MSNGIFKLIFLALVVSEISGVPNLYKGPCAPGRPLAEKFLYPKRVHSACPANRIGENLGKFGGPQLAYQKSQENSAAGRHPFGPSTATRKNRNHSAM